MEHRRLYPEPPCGPLGDGPEWTIDADCQQCTLHRYAQHRCLPADGTQGGLYVAGKHPGKVEDVAARCHVGASGKSLRRVVAKHWQGPVALDNVCRCYPGPGRSTTPTQLAACRPYMRTVLRAVQPTRLIALGSEAAYAMTGRSPPVLSVRRGYSWERLPDGRLVPLYFVMHPAAGERNQMLKRWFEIDLAWALRSPTPPLPPWDATMHYVQTPGDARWAVAELRFEAPWFAYDMEWAGTPFTDYFEVVCVACCSSGCDDAFVWEREALQNPGCLEPLLQLLADPSVGKVGHNIKADNSSVWAAWGVQVRGTYGDTRLWRRLLEAESDGRLEVCAELVGMGGHKAENDAALDVAVKRIQRKRNDQAKQQLGIFGDPEPAMAAALAAPHEHPLRYAYAMVPPEVRARYCARDAVSTARLGDLLEGRLADRPEIQRVWDLIVHDATDAVEQMERWGIAADRQAMHELDEYLGLELSQVRQRLGTYGTFNPNSPDDVAKLLFGTLGLKPVKQTPGGKRPSTDKEVLTKLSKAHPVVADIIEHRRLEKMRSNWGKKTIDFIRKDGRIHPELKLDGAATGRLSCIAPPLHQLPRSHTTEGQMIKRCFVAPPGYSLLNADYSQVELRTVAFLSGDPVMISMFLSGEDFHLATAKLIAKTYWGIEPEQVEDKHRSYSKSFNFGLLYGMTDGGLARRLGTTKAKARQLREAIMGKWKVLAQWMAERLKEARQLGEARTWWAGMPARSRPLPYIRSTDNLQRANAENSAINTPVQGTASDFMLASIARLVAWVRSAQLPAKVVLTVHDSVVLEVRNDAIDHVAQGVVAIMQDHHSMGMPLKVDVEVGPTLADLKPWQPQAAESQLAAQ